MMEPIETQDDFIAWCRKWERRWHLMGLAWRIILVMHLGCLSALITTALIGQSGWLAVAAIPSLCGIPMALLFIRDSVRREGESRADRLAVEFGGLPKWLNQ